MKNPLQQKGVFIMKKLFIITVLSLFTTSAFAISQEALIAIASSKFIESVPDVHTLEIVETIRCRNCYVVKVSGTTPTGPGYIVLRTSQVDYNGPINVFYVEGSMMIVR
jgi:hypothetical protein